MVAREVTDARHRPPRVAPTEWEYRPHLDGLRALAVYLVVVFHAGIDLFSGGFIGVDVFFVLSGYLVTQVLLRDLMATGGIRIGRFYARRYRRLLPAAFFALLVIAAVYDAVATPAEVVDTVGAFRTVFLYVANWFFIRQSNDYFGPHINASPVMHFWSLSIEEQFYACWPLLLLALFTVTRPARQRQWAIVRGAVGLGAVLSFLLAAWLTSTNLNRAYYGTDTRAYQLLAGAFLALTPRLFALGEREALWRRMTSGALMLLVVIATSLWQTGPITRGLGAALGACALITALENSRGGLVKRAFQSSPIVYLGRVSYGTYLWHWPIILVATRTFKLSSLAAAEVTVLLATGLASLSYQLLERPVRASRLLDAHHRSVIAVGVAISIASAFALVPAILEGDASRAGAVVSGSEAGGETPVPPGLDWRSAQRDRPEFPHCFGKPAEQCVVVRGSGSRIMLIGDSHARMFLPAFEQIARKDSLTLSVAMIPVCPWQESLYYVRDPAENSNPPTWCRSLRDDWYGRLVPELDPDIVVLAQYPIDDPDAPPVRMIDARGEMNREDRDFAERLRDASAQTIRRFRDDGRKVLIIAPIPITRESFNPVACLSGASFLDQCRYVARESPTPLEEYYRQSALQAGVWSIDLDRLVCPYFPICDPVVHGLIVKRDNQHLTTKFAASLADRIEVYLRSNQILSDSVR